MVWNCCLVLAVNQSGKERRRRREEVSCIVDEVFIFPLSILFNLPDKLVYF